MIEYIIPVAVVAILFYGIYYAVTMKNKSGGGGIITGNVLLGQFDSEDKKRAKAEIRYHKEIKKQEGELGEVLPPDPDSLIFILRAPAGRAHYPDQPQES